MDPKLASNLISLYENGIEEFGWKIKSVKTGVKQITLVITKRKQQKEYKASVSDQPLDGHVAVLRQAYWELKDGR